MGILWHIIPLVFVAYGVFFVYDWCAAERPTSMGSAARALFPLGCLMLVSAMGILLVDEIPTLAWDAVAAACLIAAVICAIFLVYALFFSLPSGTYTAPEQRRHVYTQGMYAICRHPGVLWLCLLCLALGLMLRSIPATITLALVCAGDLAYMLMQDRWTFPRIFEDYASYQASTPLFFPNPASIKRACGSRSQQPPEAGDRA